MGALYQIAFPNGKSYIGITSKKTAGKRFLAHAWLASKGDANYAVHRALRKYGTDNVVLRTLAIADDWAYLQLIERNAIRVFGTFGKGGYNMTAGGDGTFGVVQSASTVAKRIAKTTGAVRTPEQRARISAAHIGRKATPEQRKAMSARLKANPISPEGRANHAAALRGRVVSEAHKAAISAAKARNPMSAEQRAALSVTMKSNRAKMQAAKNAKRVRSGA